ncbi:DUF493 family protein [Myroides injenensis]|uniref:DUF493 family protein n=1 Tax=Myroides injenensis TaxID=1183151 RepID=UPI000288920A|nr:DUF493 family protein [Myroides injenensis]
MDEKTQEFYKRLKEELEKERSWPGPYLFKFIIPNNLDSLAVIEKAFDGTDADIQTRNSSNGAFTSVSVKVTMQNGQEIVDKYIAVSSIEGLISL